MDRRTHHRRVSRLSAPVPVRGRAPIPWAWRAAAVVLVVLFASSTGVAQDLLASTCFDPAYGAAALGPVFTPPRQHAVLTSSTTEETASAVRGTLSPQTEVVEEAIAEAVSTEVLLLRSGRILELFPLGRLWEPPLANQHEPRFAAKFREEDGNVQISTALGTVVPVLGRLRSPDAPDHGVQLDLFAVVFTRLDGDATLSSADYRVGLPLTAAIDRWQLKIAFEHTSSHIGDAHFEEQFPLLNQQYPRLEVVRDEVVLGIARRFGRATRVYGQVAYNFAIRLPYTDDIGVRFDWGAEWTPSSVSGNGWGPFCALDMEFRGQQSLSPATTFQIGVQRRMISSISSSVRLAAEYYDGPSPWGQLILTHESWWALTLAYDW
jgi:uncharacterized protein DUF1207